MDNIESIGNASAQSVTASDNSVDGIIAKVVENSGKSTNEINKLISEKQDELSGLVSAEGAAYIVARELGINLLKPATRQFKIKNLIPGLRSVELQARIVRIFEPREWIKEDRSGKVASVVLGDETGSVRLTLWNDDVDMITNKVFAEGDVVNISGANVMMDNRGQVDLRLGKGSIEKSGEVSSNLPLPDEIRVTSSSQRKDIADFKEGDTGETRACIVQLFKRSKPFYEVCGQCGGRAIEGNGKYICKEHGEIEPQYNMIVSGVIDDGKANIRTVFFKEVAEAVMGKNVAELREELSKGKSPEEIYGKSQSLGKEFIFNGRIKRNDLSGSLEMVANSVKEIDIKEESNKIILAIGSNS